MALFMVFGLCLVWGGVAFAGDAGMCDYSKHVNQAKAEKADTKQKEATQSATEKLFLVQADKIRKAVPVKK
jgi:hypothetical protein